MKFSVCVFTAAVLIAWNPWPNASPLLFSGLCGVGINYNFIRLGAYGQGALETLHGPGL